MDAIQPKFPMKNEYRSQSSSSSSQSLPLTYTIVLRLKSLETCYFDIPVLDDAIKLAETLDALIINTGIFKFNSIILNMISIFLKMDQLVM
jgi:hypothetical protein